MTAIHDVIIIGSGPAGYTAALCAARARLKPLVVEGSVTAGGALMNTTDAGNYPGFPGGIMGPDLTDAMRNQAERSGARLVAEDVTEVGLKADPRRVIVEGETYLAKAVINATGSGDRELGVPGERRLGMPALGAGCTTTGSSSRRDPAPPPARAFCGLRGREWACRALGGRGMNTTGGLRARYRPRQPWAAASSSPSNAAWRRFRSYSHSLASRRPKCSAADAQP